MNNMVLPAVDELTALRKTLSELREREEELCDEIRANASELSVQRINGGDRVAVIETRTTRSLDTTLLPVDILNDPAMYTQAKQTYVLLWPRSKSAADAVQAAPSELITMPTPAETLYETEYAPATDIETDATELSAAPEFDPIDPDASAEFSEDIAQPQCDAETVDVFDSETSAAQFDAPHDDQLPDDQLADHLDEAPLTAATAQTEADFAALNIPTDAVTDGPDLSVQILDAHEIAQTAQEHDSPADLRATDHPQLQPLGGLYDDDLEAAFNIDDDEMPLSADQEALEDTQALQSDYDAHVAQGEDLQQMPKLIDHDTPFVSRRIIGMPA
ncbi:hypothetical protein EDD53_0250 [Pacificibacter maritimus]|uniref:Uncharacterized protein n=1 Tax=Pacificibacter maritimus TaxID=762213 RepID=A0A3N4V221_9RHOB|nr:hypothetical protein [Pacificibacter maritimus]RPE71137.1 hypothetical protein EDD53_0250 [Pacificibacter maritimus]